jgi:CHAD domain-containing protein
MAYRFKRRETVADGFRRIVQEEFLGLTTALANAAGASIHEARKRCKMLRALLQLLDGSIDGTPARRADEAVGKIAQTLAPVRDAEVRRATLAALLAKAGPQATKRFAHVQAMLDVQASEARHLRLTAADFKDVGALADSAQRRLLALPLAKSGWKALGPGLRRTYRRGRKAFTSALNDPSPEFRHRWRKRVKPLWYHLCLLQGSQPKKITALVEKVGHLANLLGDENDLAVLRQHLEAHGKRIRARIEFDGITTLIDHRRTELRRKADRLGRKIYDEKPVDFTGHLERAWRGWRAKGK